MKNIFKKISKQPSEIYVFWTSLIFFAALWLVNPGNYFVAAGFLILIVIYYYRTKDFRISLLLAYLASLIISSGKRYTIELVPPGIFPREIFPDGYSAFFIISPKHILAFLMLFTLIRDFITKKGKILYRFQKIDLLVVAYFFWTLLSGVFGSKRPDISILIALAGLDIFVLYIYLRTYAIKDIVKFIPLLIGLASSLVIFESFIAFQQFIAHSPIYKTLESQVDIEYFGHIIDEPEFTFRPVGTFEHANILGMWMSFWLIVIFSYLYKNLKKLFILAFLAGLVTLILTLSRSSWFGFGIGFLLVLLLLEKVKKVKPPEIFTKHFWVLSFAALILFAIFVLPRAERSLYTFSEGGGALRFLQIEESIGLISQNIIFGVGTAMSVVEGLALNPSGIYSQVALVVHNWYLYNAVENGLPALIFFLSFLTISLKKNLMSFLKKKLVEPQDILKLGFIGGVLALMVVGVFQPFIGESLIFLSFGIMSYSK